MELEYYDVTQEDIDFINSFEMPISTEQLDYEHLMNLCDEISKAKELIKTIEEDILYIVPVDYRIDNYVERK